MVRTGDYSAYYEDWGGEPATESVWFDTSGFDGLADTEEGADFVPPVVETIFFDDENWPGEGVVYADLTEGMSEEELAEYEASGGASSGASGTAAAGGTAGLANGAPGIDTNAKFPDGLPVPPGTVGNPISTGDAFMVTATGVSEEQAKAYMEQCKAAGFNKNAETEDMSAYGLGLIFSAEDAAGRYLTVMLSGGTLQVALE